MPHAILKGKISKEWEHLVIVTLLERPLGYRALCSKIFTIWKSKGSYKPEKASIRSKESVPQSHMKTNGYVHPPHIASEPSNLEPDPTANKTLDLILSTVDPDPGILRISSTAIPWIQLKKLAISPRLRQNLRDQNLRSGRP
ncbi:hypothetical protein Nepgr_003812 [Nepenthes gracilis]|uniref:Uncharacterized protein n=1 Tax=Nepenthes gracilis TaxID=150966 RepID=A0AAD3S077_NEPGR|nr:hypothetical protein Nepgr_003812 [Nepenthes gracilis]